MLGAISVTTTSHEVTSARREVRALPLDLWPEADRNAWNAACQPASRLKRGGAAGHLKPVTRDDRARHYGCFLDFLDRCGLLQPDDQAAANVTVDNVHAYITELKDRVSSVTVYGSICKLRSAAQYVGPGRVTWLAEIGKDLAFVMRPRAKFHRLVATEVLVEAGLSLIHEGEVSRKLSENARARQVRNGLMVALLALCPIRRKNFAALEIGRSFQKVRGKWWILLSASETKENRADERPIDELNGAPPARRPPCTTAARWRFGENAICAGCVLIYALEGRLDAVARATTAKDTHKTSIRVLRAESDQVVS